MTSLATYAEDGGAIRALHGGRHDERSEAEDKELTVTLKLTHYHGQGQSS